MGLLSDNNNNNNEKNNIENNYLLNNGTMSDIALNDTHGDNNENNTNNDNNDNNDKGNNKIIYFASDDSLKGYFWLIFRLAWPSSVNSLISFSIQMINTIFIGRLGSVELGSAAIGNMIANLTGFSISLGFTTALDTLCSQAYGAKQFTLVGLITQRCIVILTILTVPLGVIWSQSEHIARLMGMSDIVCSLSGRWVNILIFGIWPNLICEAIKKWLLAQSLLRPIVITSAITSVLNLLYNYLLVYVFDLGFDGPAIATVLSYWTMLITLVACVCIRNYRIKKKYAQIHNYTPLENNNALLNSNNNDSTMNPELINCWPPLSWSIFKGWWIIIKLGIPGALSLFVEWGSYELCAAAAGKLGNVSLAVHSIFMNTVQLWYCICLGIASSCSILIGNYLGAKHPHNAKLTAKYGIIIAAIYGIINGFIFTVALRTVWGKLFTSDSKVLNSFESIEPILYLYGFFDSTKAVCMAVLRGCGRPTITVIGNILSCYLVQFPLIYLLVFTSIDGGLILVWFSMSCAWLCATLVYSIVLYKTDWDKQVLIAQQRNQKSEIITTNNTIDSNNNNTTTDQVNESLLNNTNISNGIDISMESVINVSSPSHSNSANTDNNIELSPLNLNEAQNNENASEMIEDSYVAYVSPIIA